MPTDEEIAAAEAIQEKAANELENTDDTIVVDEPVVDDEVKPDVNTVNAELNTSIKALTDRLTPQLTAAEKEAQIVAFEKETGLSRTALQFIAKNNEENRVQSGLGFARQNGLEKARVVLGKYAPKLQAKVEAEMAKMSPTLQANPQNWEDMANLMKGRHGDSVVFDDNADDKVVDTKVVGGNVKGLTGNKKAGGAGKGNDGKVYSDDEKTIISQYFGGKADQYEESKAHKTVGLPRKEEGSKTSNAADREYARMTGGNT